MSWDEGKDGLEWSLAKSFTNTEIKNTSDTEHSGLTFMSICVFVGLEAHGLGVCCTLRVLATLVLQKARLHVIH